VAGVSLSVGGIPIHGRSRAGQESYYHLPTLRSALEIGRCPQSLVAVSSIFVTHAHLDHAAGIATYASQRTLHGMAPGRVYVPAQAREGLARILEIHRGLEAVDAYEASVEAVAPGDSIALRPDLTVRVLPSHHRVPTVGYLFVERRRKLKPELSCATPQEVAARRARGEDVSVPVEIPLLAYPGDCDPRVFDIAPEIFAARVLLLECTFLRPGDEERGRIYGHLHLADIVARASDFRNEAIVLTHFSARYSRGEILELLEAGLPPSLRERVTAFV
jgi:ribonuclease Z